KPYKEILDRLFVQALVIDDGAQKVAILRWDLVDVSESARDEVRKRISASLHMPAGNILINASHNHSAPWTPAYTDGYRGKERDTWWALRFMPAQNAAPPFARWMDRLLSQSLKAAQDAAALAKPAAMSIARVSIGEYVQNRRPRAPRWGVVPSPAGAARARNLDPAVLAGGATFGELDRAMSIVSFRDAEDRIIASLFHLAGHSVSIYPSNPGLSADWPGPASATISAALGGGEALFLQGCAGDINPWRRGAAAVAEMAVGLGEKARAAEQGNVRLVPGKLQVVRAEIGLPLTPAAQTRTGLDSVRAELQVVVCGPLAIVALPGEVMTGVGARIREASPYPQTLVLGYSNGNGVHYVGLPGEKVRGGYEAGTAGAGTDECGAMLVETASRLLNEVYARSAVAAKALP
ncbi:MAG: hypothetical protein RIQ93_3317, partial [Verrucomicrobiota bacterium]